MKLLTTKILPVVWGVLLLTAATCGLVGLATMAFSWCMGLWGVW